MKEIMIYPTKRGFMRINIAYQKIPSSTAFNIYINEGIKQHHHILGDEGHIEWIVGESKKDKISKVHYKSKYMHKKTVFRT